MRITFVVQRYGEEILGGAETLARQVAQRLTPYHNVEVLTTCARDYATWENVFPPGPSMVNGVRVYRHPTVETRNPDFGRLSAQLYGRPRTLDQELEWLYAQGPWAPSLLDQIWQRRDETDVFFFFTYIYYPTALGLRLASDKAVLVPTAHDEPALEFRVFDALFHSPRGIFYSTEEERALVQRRFGNSYVPSAIVGLGVDVPSEVSPKQLRAKLGITQPYFLYLGRIVESKGCDELLAHYQDYCAQYPDESVLVLLGKAEMRLPSCSSIVYGGYVSEADKYAAISGATALLVPSRYESLSIVALEAWAMGRPVVATASGQVVGGLCRRSNAGLQYRNREEFAEVLHLLVTNPNITQHLGNNGRRYVTEVYSWERVIGEYRRMIDYVTHRPLGGLWGSELSAIPAKASSESE